MADQDFEQLLKVVERLNQQLSELASKAVTAKSALKGATTPEERVSAGGRIGGYSTAINRIEVELRQALSRVLREISQSNQAEYTRQGRVPQNNLSFINAGPVRQGLEAANVQGKIDTEVKKFARDVATRFQQSLIQGAIESRNAQINRQQNVLLGDEIVRRQQPEYKVKQMLDREVARFQAEVQNAIANPTQSPRPTPGGVLGRITQQTKNEANAAKYVDIAVEIGLVEQKIKELERTELREGSGAAAALQKQIDLYRQLGVELRNVQQDIAKTASQHPSITQISGGAAGKEADINSAWRNAFVLPPDLSGQQGKPVLPAGQQMTFGMLGMSEQEKAPASVSTSKYMQDWLQNRAKMTTASAQRAKVEEELLKVAQNEFATEKKYAQARAQAAALGFTPDNLKRLETRGTAGITRARLQRTDEYGVDRVFDTFVNPNGKATPGISNQFRTFGQGVVRDIGEFTKWSIALAAVYTPMRKLGELIQEMISNQAKLAEATVTVNSAFVDQSKIFDVSAEAAEAVGESVSGVIDAFTSAYRAAGGGSDQVERLVTAQTLLNDSLTLSKLSTLDQAGAIDTLSAALRQSGDSLEGVNDPLQKGSQLLDKWVRVTKVANVDLATLATGFAVLGDAAEAAGIDVDELNGVIGAIAETGISSGREAANTARAIVAGFQSDEARKQLESLGVAVEDSSGKLRPFLEIMQELYNLRKAGVIDKTQFSELTLALGGGTRRQAAYSTFIENFNRVSEIAQQSAQANGDAQAALARQLETVQTALTKLGNAFSSLAQTMGTEGGFLEIIKDSVNFGTALVKVFDQLVAVLGKATPAMAAFIAATLIARQKGLPGVQAMVGGLLTTVPQPSVGAGGGGWQQYMMPGIGSPEISKLQKSKNFAAENLLGTNAWSGAFQGLALSAIPAILNATNKEDKFGGTKAAFDVAGGVIGGVVGALTGPQGALIGAAIGTSIAEAFVNTTIAYKTNIFGYATGPTLGNQVAGAGTPDERNAALVQAEAGIYKGIGGGNEQLGRFLAGGPQKVAGTLVEQINEAIKTQDKGRLEDILGQTFLNSNIDAMKRLNEAGISRKLVDEAFAQGQTIEFNPENLAYQRTTRQAQQEYDRALGAVENAGEGGAVQETTFSKMVEDNKKAYGDLLNELKASSKETLGTQRLSGDIKGADYARRTGALQGFDVKALQYYSQFGEKFIEINKDVTNATEAFTAFNEVILSGTADTVPEITSLGAEIQNLINILGDPTQQTPDALEALGFKNLDEVKTELVDLQETAATLFDDVYKQSQLVGLQIPSINGDISKPLTSGENTLVEERTKKLQDSFYQGFLKLPDDTYEALKDSFDEFAVTIKDSGEEFYQRVVDTDEQFRQAALQQLQEEGKIRSQKESQFGIQQVDMTSAEGAGLQGSVDYFSGYLSKFFPQYKQNPEDVGIIFSDYVTSVLHGDNLAIKLALEKLVDINQKQLDGMYNIPEGATFWVPLTAAYYRPKDEGGAGTGMPIVDSAAVDGNTTATEMNTQALMNMTDKWNNADPFLYKKPPEPHEDRYEKMNKVDEPITKYAPGSLASPLRGSPTPGFRGDPGYSREPRAESILEGLKNFLNGLYQSIQNYNKNQGLGVPVGASGGRAAAGLSNATPQPVQARLDLKFDNSVQLIVDGRVLASVVTPYLATDLIKLEASQGTITKRYVI